MKKHTVAEVMTRDVVAVRASTGYKEIVETLANHSVSAVPVVNDEGRVLGVVSEADLLYKTEYADQPHPSSRLWERKRVRAARAKAAADTAADLMTVPAVSIGPRDRISAAARLMDAEAVKRLPVVDEHGQLVGIVSRKDLLRLYLREDGEIEREIRDDVFLRALWIDPVDISIEVAQGVVTLVQGVAGVVDVVNHLTYHVDDRKQRRTEQFPIVA
jgi:CBS domain-containing protein